MTTPRPAPVPERPSPGRAPAAVRAVTALVLLQALALAVATVALLVALVRGTSMPGPVVFMAVLAAGIGAVLAGAAVGLLRGRRWGRAPVMTVQILLVVLAVGWVGVELAAWSVVVLAVAGATGVLLVLPPVVAWTAGDRT